MLSYLSLIGDAVVALGLIGSGVFYLIGLYSAFEFFSKRRSAPAGPGAEPVSVLKPLKGLDIGLYENLATLCRQTHERYQIVCGVADAQDPAIGVVRRLQRDFPQVDIELVIDARVYGTNYKVSNLHNMYRRAKHDLIVIADSDIRVGPDYLSRLVAGLQPRDVGIVTCVYRAVNSGGLPTAFESLFINTGFANLVMVARKVEKATYAFGATIAMRRRVLDEIGGFLPIVNYLADDYQLGYRVAELGYRLELTDELVDTVIAVGSWHRLFTHQLRWARTYRISRPGGYFGSILTHGPFFALLNVLYHGFSPLSCAASLAVIGLRYAVAANLAWRCLGTRTPWRELLLVGPMDLLLSAVWFLAFAGNTVSWSGHEFVVGRNGEMTDLTPTTFATPADIEEEEAAPPRRRAGSR